MEMCTAEEIAEFENREFEARLRALTDEQRREIFPKLLEILKGGERHE